MSIFVEGMRTNEMLTVQAMHEELLAEIERLKAEVELWKDRCAAERQAHEATIKHCDDMLNDRSI